MGFPCRIIPLRVIEVVPDFWLNYPISKWRPEPLWLLTSDDSWDDHPSKRSSDHPNQFSCGQMRASDIFFFVSLRSCTLARARQHWRLNQLLAFFRGGCYAVQCQPQMNNPPGLLIGRRSFLFWGRCPQLIYQGFFHASNNTKLCRPGHRRAPFFTTHWS